MKCCDLGMKAEFVMTKEEYQKRLQKKTHRKRANESFNFNAELVSYMEFQLDFQKEKIPENSPDSPTKSVEYEETFEILQELICHEMDHV